MAMSTKKVLFGVGLATAIGAAIALASGGASASGRQPWTDPFEPPTPEDITDIKATICTLHRGGTDPSDLLFETIDRVYPGVPWASILDSGQVEGDDPSLWQIVSLHVALIQAYLGLPEAQREAWCADPQPPPVPGPVQPPPPPPKPGAIPSDVIGGGWNNWPEKTTWKSEGDIGAALNSIGYPVAAGFLSPGYKITTQKNRDAIKAFQKDFNAFRGKEACTPLVPPTVLERYLATPKHLTTDGWIGPNTWKAMRFAFHLHALPNASWLKFAVACKGI